MIVAIRRTEEGKIVAVKRSKDGGKWFTKHPYHEWAGQTPLPIILRWAKKQGHRVKSISL